MCLHVSTVYVRLGHVSTLSTLSTLLCTSSGTCLLYLLCVTSPGTCPPLCFSPSAAPLQSSGIPIRIFIQAPGSPGHRAQHGTQHAIKVHKKTTINIAFYKKKLFWAYYLSCIRYCYNISLPYLQTCMYLHLQQMCSLPFVGFHTAAL